MPNKEEDEGVTVSENSDRDDAVSENSDRDDAVSENSVAAGEAGDAAGEAGDSDDGTDDAADTGDATRVEPANERRPWKRYAGIGLVAAVYLGAFGLAGILGWKLWEQRTLTEAGQTAQQTAINYAQVLTSIDSNNLDQNFAEVLNGATGDFKDMYTKDSMQLRQLLIDNKATAKGVVIDSAIQSESKDKVTVLLLVDQTVSNTARPDARSDSSRMKITMEKVDDRWLASNVELP